jgi:pyrroloquinoline-quinone synthase
MSLLIQKIDELIEQHSLLKHQFYQMWSDGKLSQESLSGYSKEYFQLVKHVPSFVASVAKYAPQSNLDEIRANQKEESEHIVPWTRFAKALGVSESELEKYGGLEKTRKPDAQGYFIISLPPGTYALAPAGGEVLPQCETATIEVLPDAFAYADLSCDTGIR